MEHKGATIRTGVGGGVNALSVVNPPVRYYLKKLLREDVNESVFRISSITTPIRYTNLSATPSLPRRGAPTELTITPPDAIAAIRKRAGIMQPDTYLNGITDKNTSVS